MDADGPDDTGLEVSVPDILKAFELAGPYATGNSNTKKFEHRWEMALGIIDRAIMECDRGLRLLELTNEVHDLQKELVELKRKQGGTFYLP